MNGCVSIVARASMVLAVALVAFGCEKPDAISCVGDTPTLCGITCTNLNVDFSNCGACGRTCATGQVCVNGNCDNTCPDTQKVCGNRCIDKNGCCLDTDCRPDEMCLKDTCVPKADLSTSPPPDMAMDASVNPPADMADTRDLAIPPAPDAGPNNPCPPGSTLCGNLCINTNNDPANCNRCGNACKVGEACFNGQCVPFLQQVCGFPTQQCGNLCVNIQNDPLNCGGCSKVCSSSHIVGNMPTCLGGVCNGACTWDYGDCNSDKQADGCETPVHSDINNCGGCNNKCGPVFNGSPSCLNAACVTQCNAGFADCDGKYQNGCERNLNYDSTSCGGCGNICPGNMICASGSCICPQGQTSCNNTCVTLASDAFNCGACGTVCPQGNLCSNGKCVLNCPQGTNPCGNSCVNMLNDPSNCGSCGTICPPVVNGFGLCGNGKCVVAQCNPGFADCNGLPNDGCEKNLNADAANCGACNKACPQGQACQNGACVVQCDQNHAACNNACVDLRADPNNCGKCGTICVAGQACLQGVCINLCQPGESVCSGFCRDLKADSNHCGACNNACPPVINGLAACVAGKCAAACNTGFRDCNANANDGCEKNITNDPLNCGGCNNACANGVNCVNGACANVDAGVSDAGVIDAGADLMIVDGGPDGGPIVPAKKVTTVAIDALYANTGTPKAPSQGDFVGAKLAPVSVTVEGKAIVVPGYTQDVGYILATPVVPMNQATYRVVWCYTLAKIVPEVGYAAVSYWPTAKGYGTRYTGNTGVSANGQVCFTEDLPVNE